jgi:hypothetical protein
MNARFIIPCWGKRHAKMLGRHTLPALLAPGNLSAVAANFATTLVIVTERRLMGYIGSWIQPGVRVEFKPLDDLLVNDYGTVLSRALFRGFEDLGPEMVNTHLFFLNVDFIVAAGSFRRVVERILDGARTICAPSYCVVEEKVKPLLLRWTFEKRELAALILKHRHNTIRAKTVNRPAFGIHRYDQFYWEVDRNTLLGRQMPVAVVYFRPERVVTEMRTVWDYGVLSEFCPTVPASQIRVLGDSDDFLMAELRPELTFADLLRPTRQSPEEIAVDLSTWTTLDQRAYGRAKLRLHSNDLPPGYAWAEQELDKYVSAIYAKLGPPVSHLNHQFWNQARPPAMAWYRRAVRALPFYGKIRGRGKPQWLRDMEISCASF